jgi:serine/threonine protein kinase
MPAPATSTELIDLIQKSGVIEGPRLASYLQSLPGESALPAEPAACAEKMVRDGILTRFQAEQLLLGKWKRFSIGKYKILERLGAGGMGQVFLCEHKLMRRRVAVKVLPAAKANSDSSRERFYREARAVAALDHPNLVRAHDIDQDDNLHFIVMEYVDGCSLHEIVRRTGPMDATRACHYVYWAAEGLRYAYEVAELIHRDIKPGNILVDRSGVVKILDMGLARFFNDEEDLLTKKFDDNVLGTADYLSPEQARDSHNVDIRADIYSLGATFYYLLTGRPPFAEGSVAQKLIWHQTRQPKPVRLLRPDVPDAVAAILERMMMKEPAARYQTPAELADALAQFVQTPIPPPSEAEVPRLSPAAAMTAGTTVPAYASGRYALPHLGPTAPRPAGLAAAAASTTTAGHRTATVHHANGSLAPATGLDGKGTLRTGSKPAVPILPPTAVPAAPKHATPAGGGTNLFANLLSGDHTAAVRAARQAYATATTRAGQALVRSPARHVVGGRRWLVAVLIWVAVLVGGWFAVWRFFVAPQSKAAAWATPSTIAGTDRAASSQIDGGRRL